VAFSSAGAGEGDDRATWLERFHAGDREVLEACYREHFHTVGQAVGQVLRGADRETVVHDVFVDLLANANLRRGFVGGAFATWLGVVARNRAVDYWRRYRREGSLDEAAAELAPSAPTGGMEEDVGARLLIAQFRSEVLPAKWDTVFEHRFLLGLDQREAARRLGISRTTLAYREAQVRRLLGRFARRGERSRR
jgi:RNA polymerase sigma-70 factor (ECF subfamily)